MTERNSVYTELYSQIESFHEEDKHQQIIELIRDTEGFEQNYKLVGMLARAHNNIDEYREAMELLESVAEEGKEDKLWYYRLGYAYYYGGEAEGEMEKALELFQRAYELGDMDSLGMIGLVKANLEMELSEEEEIALNALVGEYDGEPPLVYSEEEMEAIETHTSTWFGAHESVFHELISPDLHIDLLLIEPRPGHDYYTLVTMGAGAHRMNIPDGYEGPDRAEFLINLPKEWDIHSEEESSYWPLRWLKILARLSLHHDTWLGWGHTIPSEGPFAENTLLNNVILTEPLGFEEESLIGTLPNGERVVFWQLVPLYEEELQYKLENDAVALEEAFDGFPAVLDIARPLFNRKQ